MKILKSLTKNNILWLLFILVQKETKSRYKSTTLGFLWAFLNPLIQMLVLSVVFTIFIRIPVPNYPIFAFTGLLPWTFFNLATLSSTSSLLENKDFLKKINFNYFLIPISSIIANLVNFIISLFLLTIFIITASHFLTPINIVNIFLATTILTCLLIGIGLTLSSLNLYYRDVYYITQSALLAGFYLSPIIYPQSLVPQQFQTFYKLNPLVGILSLFRTGFINSSPMDTTALTISTAETAIMFLIGLLIFKHRKPFFTDWI